MAAFGVTFFQGLGRRCRACISRTGVRLICQQLRLRSHRGMQR